MADYYPLIVRAVAGLEHNTGDNRRVLYERARHALVNQLRGVEPALEEADITRERLALEEAIRKVEAETAAAEPAPEPPPEAESEAPAPPPPPPSLRDQGLRDFRASIAEADELGDAASEANRAAHETYAAVPGDHSPAPPAEPAAPAATHYFEPPAEPPSEPAPAEAFAPRRNGDAHAEAPAADQAPPLPPPPPPLYEEEGEETAYKPARSHGRLIALVVLLLVIAGLAGAGYWQRHAIGTLVASLHFGQSATKPTPPPTRTGKPKITDRVPPAKGPTRSANVPAAAVAQKVVLYEEEPGNPHGKPYVGSAIWKTETVSPGPGLAPELAVRADVEIPERHMRMTFSLRRNTDKALPASHTIEIMFTLPADFDQGSISSVPGVLAKANEQARGVPLAGLSVKVTNGYFLIGLSAVDIDKQRNIMLLKDRDWLEIPIGYTSGKRAILAMEKGPPGQRAFQEAFRAWGE